MTDPAALRAPDTPELTPRLFFALVPDAPARSRLEALARALASETGGRAPPGPNLHLTLAFLGQVPRSRVNDIESIGERAAAAGASFDVVLDTVGHFRDARVAWAGPSIVVAPLQCAYDDLRDALAAAGLPHERRKFHPHVTLVRHCRRAPAPRAWPGASWRADELTLMASESHDGGPRYRTTARWPLSVG
jgi:2'-5' RNA ligase